MKVLVVDDSATMRRIIRRILAEVSDFEMLEAGDGKEAFELFSEHQDLDLIVTDWNMPVMSGLKLTTKIRETGSKIPILMVTTNATSNDVIEALKAGVNNYVTKPMTKETVQEKLAMVLPGLK